MSVHVWSLSSWNRPKQTRQGLPWGTGMLGSWEETGAGCLGSHKFARTTKNPAKKVNKMAKLFSGRVCLGEF